MPYDSHSHELRKIKLTIKFSFYVPIMSNFAASRATLISLHACIKWDCIAVCIPRPLGVGSAAVVRGAHLASPLELSLVLSTAWFT